MDQKIGYTHNTTEPVTDLDVIFTAMYNLLYEKYEQEPKKGIIVSEGNPNQRKVTWKRVLKMAHALEDFFTLRKQRTGGTCCGECMYWSSLSEASPQLGKCAKYGKEYVHPYSCCKSGFAQRGESYEP